MGEQKACVNGATSKRGKEMSGSEQQSKGAGMKKWQANKTM